VLAATADELDHLDNSDNCAIMSDGFIIPGAPVMTPALAYSYLRFSSRQQAKGDSIRRQTEARDAWCLRNKVELDTSLTLTDKGVSAFTGGHRENPDRHALAAFLRLVEAGRIPKGSYLIVEALDRLSREDAVPALQLLLGLLTAGVRVVQLQPVEMVYDAKSDPMRLMVAIMELSRGHSESKMKSERVGGAWREKKRNAASKPLTAMCPAWLRLKDDRFETIPEYAEAVKEIFRLSLAGYGIGVITRRLNRTGVPAMGKSGKWVDSYVAAVLANRAVVGEYQPFRRERGKRVPDGEPVPSYYPAVISEREFDAVRACIQCRKGKPGRPPTGKLNLFTRLLHCARHGGTICLRKSRRKGGGHMRILAPTKARLGLAGRQISFPADAFERAILSRLREIDPREILPRDDRLDETLSLSGRLAAVEGKITTVTAQMVANPDVEGLVSVLRSLEAEKREVAERLAEARRNAATPLGEAWGQCRSLLDAMDDAADQGEARVRLRAAMRRTINGIWCLFIGRGSWRVAAAQVYFAGGAHRDYLILRRPAHGGGTCPAPRRAETLLVRSFASAGVAAEGELDLRKPAHARRLERVLLSLDLSQMP
jgi:DNA invertase Pin-like site-specific DNA recombinase